MGYYIVRAFHQDDFIFPSSPRVFLTSILFSFGTILSILFVLSSTAEMQ